MASVRAVFDDWEHFKSALAMLKRTRGRRYTAYAPVNLKAVQDLMPEKSSLVRGWSTSCAGLGLLTFFLMCVLTSLIYSLVVGGKPPVSNIPYVVPMYEGTILVGAIGAFLAALAYARLRSRALPSDYDIRFSGESFGIDVECRAGEQERLTSMLKEAGAVEVYEP